ncbi:MAG: thioredoxin [Candidatus Lokiarchaeota archaeon]|nr:thioredoxin [Candidatus Lokiarchaeota archaeon]
MKKAEMLVNSQSVPKDIIHINSSEELKKIISDFPNKIIIIDFWAVWCGPCRFISPIFEKLHSDFSNDFIFAKVNVDENRQLSQQFRISGIPTILFLKNDEIINRIIGALGYEQFKEILNKLKQ